MSDGSGLPRIYRPRCQRQFHDQRFRKQEPGHDVPGVDLRGDSFTADRDVNRWMTMDSLQPQDPGVIDLRQLTVFKTDARGRIVQCQQYVAKQVESQQAVDVR